MVQETWPQDMGQLSTPQIWKKIRQHFSDAEESVHFFEVNDDLVGFFNSVPQDRLLSAVRSLITAGEQKHGSDLSISVDLSKTGDPTQSTFAGNFHRAGFSIKAICAQDIFKIVQCSLASHIFIALGHTWLQIRGGGIGSQISPTPSNLAVALLKRSCRPSYEELFNQPLLSLSFLAIRCACQLQLPLIWKRSVLVKNWSSIVCLSNWKKLMIIIFWDLQLM